MTTPGEDHLLQDDAAQLRTQGLSWSAIADALGPGITAAAAKRLAAASDERAQQRATANQLDLFTF